MSDTLVRATQFFLLAEYNYLQEENPRQTFWRLSADIPHETGYLAGLTATVRQDQKQAALCWQLSRHPLPIRLSPETLAWHAALIAAWEGHRSGSESIRRYNASIRALVQLDGCGMPDGMQRPSRLPEWLAEARRIVRAGCEPARTGESRVASGRGRLETYPYQGAVSEPALSEPARTGEWRVENGSSSPRTCQDPLAYEKLQGLATLAAWRPAPGVLTAPETLQEWGGFWMEMRRSPHALVHGIASMALLNLSDGNPVGSASMRRMRTVTTANLLDGLSAAIRIVAWSAEIEIYSNLDLLNWTPRNMTAWPARSLVGVIGEWLEALHSPHPGVRWAAAYQLLLLERAGMTEKPGNDLLRHFVTAVHNERNDQVLRCLSRWKPGAGSISDRVLFMDLERHWQQYRQSFHDAYRTAGWEAGIHFHRAGLASESPAAFVKAYLSAVAEEGDADVLFILARWAPGPDVPSHMHREWHEVWGDRLEDQDESIRQVAVFALLRQALKGGPGDGLRRVALGTWRTGTKADDVTHRLGSVASRFHEVRAQLAAGTVPDFELPPLPPVKRQYPQLVLPPGRIAGGEWKMENGELRMEN